jgi:hypothetical protein
MSLSPREREALSEIESHLSRGDPKLAAMLSQWRVKRARLHAVLAAVKRRAVHGRHARLVWVATGLALVIGLAVAGALSTHPARPGGPVRGQRPVSRVLPAGFQPGGAHPPGGRPGAVPSQPDPVPSRPASFPS